MQAAQGSHFTLTRVLLAGVALAFIWLLAQLFFAGPAAHADDGDSAESHTNSVTDIVSDVTDAVDDVTSEATDLVTKVTDAVTPPPATSQPPADAVPAEKSPAEKSPAENSTPPKETSESSAPEPREPADSSPPAASVDASTESSAQTGKTSDTDAATSTGPLGGVVDAATEAVGDAVTQTPIDDLTSPIAQDLDAVIDPLVGALPVVGDDLSRVVGTDLVATTTGAVSGMVDPLVSDAVTTVLGTTSTVTDMVDRVVPVVPAGADAVIGTAVLPVGEGSALAAGDDSASTPAATTVPRAQQHIGTSTLAPPPVVAADLSAGATGAADAPPASPQAPAAPAAAGSSGVAATTTSNGAGSAAADRASASVGAPSDSIRSARISDDDLPESLTLSLTCSPG